MRSSEPGRPDPEVRVQSGRPRRTQGVEPGDATVSRHVAWWLATAAEGVWRLPVLSGEPPFTRSTIVISSQARTVDGSKAREELCSDPSVSIGAGLEELRAWEPDW